MVKRVAVAFLSIPCFALLAEGIYANRIDGIGFGLCGLAALYLFSTLDI